MRITEIRDLSINLEGNISNAMVSFNDHTVSLVAVVSDQRRDGKPVIGFGFNSIGRYSQSGILRERMIPRVLKCKAEALLAIDGNRFDPAAVTKAAMQNEKPGGHGDRAGALGALELAIWDLNAKLADEPAWTTIAKAFDRQLSDPVTNVYAAGGYYYDEDSSQRLQQELEHYRELGYHAFKMKVGGASLAEDLVRIETALEVAGSGANLSIDANGRFDLDSAIEYAEAITPLDLRWFEEPGDPLDYKLNQALTIGYQGVIATGENLFSEQDVRNLSQFGGMRPGKDIFQMDPGLSYGLTEYAKMIQTLERAGFNRAECFPHGGHLINLHIAIGLGLGGCEAYPGVFQPFGGYPDVCKLEEGVVSPTDAPGFGLEQKAELQKHIFFLSENLKGSP
ncbi:MAG: L-alanine-DL-glutamate epimerase-like enolase superfamily enzyme [Candidatus Azotimanducaceae bacterium]|jgi:L-alanine-DL-glutamate epimerase-like enolase superfamily enzyme